MKIIDADDYLIEIDSAWDYMLESVKAFKTEMNSAILGTLYPQFEILAVANCLLAIAYLITLFACERNFGESVRPIRFAVYRLATNSNIVACCAGRSAGIAPFK